MKKNTFSLICYKNLLILLFLIVASKGFGQISSVNVNNNLFTSYCPSAIFNGSIPINFSYAAGTTNFKLEISDAFGVFASPSVFLNSPLFPNTSLPTNFNYTIPPNLIGGTGFRFRVSGTFGGNTNSQLSSSIELYYVSYEAPITLNGNVNTINFCGGGSFLRVDENIIGIPNLKYLWFKLPSTIPISGQTASTLLIDNIFLTAGTYYAKIDYGQCTISAFTGINVVFPGGSFATIFSSLGTTITNGLITDLKVTPISTGETYQWYLNGNLITGATNAIYSTGVAGTYKCLVINASCQGFTSPITLNFVVAPTLNFGAIPNVVSPNNDGVNDFWDLEQSDYGPNTNTEVTILSAQGETVLKTNTYTNNWPNQTIDFGVINPVYYYIISKQGQDARKGSITLIK
jgi:gliding motility-associated-like protein